MSDPLQLLQQLAAQLQQEGKTPSLALFRARLAGRLTPQQLFVAYQQWRNNPIVSAPAAADSCISDPVDSKAADDVAQALARIEAKLDLLLSKLEIR